MKKSKPKVSTKSSYVDNNKREEKLIKKVQKSADVPKGNAIAILKSKGVLKQKKGGGLAVKRSRGN